MRIGHGFTEIGGRTARPRAVLAAAWLALVLALPGCAERENEADEAARAALTVDTDTPGPRPAPAVAPLPDAAGIAPPVVEDAAPSGQWFVKDGANGVAAAWGVPNSEAVLLFTCDSARDEVVVTREAVGVPADVGVLTLDADGLRRGLPAMREVSELGPRLVARIPVRDPVLDRLRTAPRLRVRAGEDTIVASAPGTALARVLEACRSR